jgi:hypothetical protein
VHPMANRTSFDSVEGVRGNEPVAGAHRPVICGACGQRFDQRAWGLLVLVERMEPAKVRVMVLRWPDEFSIEIRRCGRCAQQIAAKRDSPATDGVAS